jgi:hypothetical protein
MPCQAKKEDKRLKNGVCLTEKILLVIDYPVRYVANVLQFYHKM